MLLSKSAMLKATLSPLAILHFVALCIASAALSAQPAHPDNKDGFVARRVPNASIRLDGRLDEEHWQSVSAITRFVQRDPVEGSAPTDQLSVRVAYDDDALWVGVRVLFYKPRPIQAPISRRDNIRQSEQVVISLDTYHDRRTAYSFAVTASGVRGDWYHPADEFNRTDLSFDPVWTAAADVNSQGWTAEMRIPFSQLRFGPSEEQVWGVNIEHWVPSKNEDVFWIAVPKKTQGWASRFGLLTGLTGVRPRRRLEVMPYAAARSDHRANWNRQNPFEKSVNVAHSAGADLKAGIGPAVTLEATINPDFGQVEADPAEVNLSAFETFFPEKRPFFVEGAQILKGIGPDYFYSRRIGERPRGPATGTFVDYPRASTILGAAKITGRIANGYSVGGLVAVTRQEVARTYDMTAKTLRDIPVAPQAAYGIGRVQKQFGSFGSTTGLSIAAVDRSFAGPGTLRTILPDQALSGGGDFNLRFRRAEYSLQGHVGGSVVVGDTLAIAALQRSSARYYQRPDAKWYHFEGNRTALAGYSASTTLAKLSGKHWLYSVTGSAKSPGLELNDAGRLSTTDAMVISGGLVYRELKSGGIFRDYSASLTEFNEWNYDRDAQQFYQAIYLTGTFRNFWVGNAVFLHNERAYDERLARGGPQMGRAAGNLGQLLISNATAARTRWSARVYYSADEFQSTTGRLSGGVSLRPGPRWQLSVDPSFTRIVDARQFIGTFGTGGAATFGKRFVFSTIHRNTFSMDFRLNLAVTPDLTIETYAQPFASSGHYRQFGELPRARSYSLRGYGTDKTTIRNNSDGTRSVTDSASLSSSGVPFTFLIPTKDFNVRSFRSNGVVRWEYRRGSTLYIVWQQNRLSQTTTGKPVGLGDLFGSFSTTAQNMLLVKASFWIPAG